MIAFPAIKMVLGLVFPDEEPVVAVTPVQQVLASSVIEGVLTFAAVDGIVAVVTD